MIPTFLERVMEEELSFGQLEKLLWKSTLSLFQHVMVEVLEQFDQILMENRDKSRFENKEKNPRSVQTMVGSVDFERRYYWDTEEHRWVYLLDEALELEPENDWPRFAPVGCYLGNKRTFLSRRKGSLDRFVWCSGAQPRSHSTSFT